MAGYEKTGDIARDALIDAIREDIEEGFLLPDDDWPDLNGEEFVEYPEPNSADDPWWSGYRGDW